MAKSILLIGLGEFGQNVAKKLYDMNADVMAIDHNEEKVNAVLPYVTDARIGDSTSRDFLVTLGIKNYDACIIAIGANFQNSLETCDLVNELSDGKLTIIARANTDIHAKFLGRHGATHVVHPEEQMAKWTAIRSTHDHVLDYIGIDEKHLIIEVEVPAKWDNKTLSEIDARNKYGVNILGIKEKADGKESLNTDIGSNTVLKEKQVILVLGHIKSLDKLFKVKDAVEDYKKL